MIIFLKNLFGLNRTFGVPRASAWPKLRKEYLKSSPRCKVCFKLGGNVPHHIVPVHIDPTKELSPLNLITLCPVHHLWVGHLGNFKSFNKDVESDAKNWYDKIINRP